MSEAFGGSLPAFIGLTGAIFGLAAVLTGQAIAETWRSMWQAVAAAVGLTIADRLLTVALFSGSPLSVTAAALTWAYLTAAMLIAWRVTLARKMVRQYPWLYEAVGVFGWRSRASHDDRPKS